MMSEYLGSSVRGIRTVAALFVMAMFWACNNTGHEQPLLSPTELKEPLVKANQHLVRSEAEDIAAYMERYGLEMLETGSGLRYHIAEAGVGLQAGKGQVARLHYTLTLLNGKKCYSSQDRGLLEFLVGKGGVESGLEEAVLLMREGGRGKFILPSHLAHGLPGDGDCIPKKSVVVYDLKLVSVIEPSMD